MKKFLLLAVLGVVFVPTVSVFAQEKAPTDSFDPVARCEAMVERSQERYSANETRQADNTARLDGSIEKLEEFVTKAAKLGADTSILSSDIQTFLEFSKMDKREQDLASNIEKKILDRFK